VLGTPVGTLGHLGDAEVEDLHERGAIRAFAEKEIRRLQVSMHDAEAVCLGDRLTGLQHPVDDGPYRQRAALLQHLPQVLTGEVFHHHVRHSAVERAYVGDARNVLALDASGRLRFAQKSLHRVRSSRRRRQQEFQSHATAEVEVHRRDDDAHSPHAEHTLDLVFLRDDLARTHGGVIHAFGRGGVVEPLGHCECLFTRSSAALRVEPPSKMRELGHGRHSGTPRTRNPRCDRGLS
jgi:hypothetical protein